MDHGFRDELCELFGGELQSFGGLSRVFGKETWRVGGARGSCSIHELCVLLGGGVQCLGGLPRVKGGEAMR